MTRVVFKYPLAPGVTALQLPLGAQMLAVADQRGVPHLWALHEPGCSYETRSVALLMTGEATALPLGRHLGTLLMAGGNFVLHAFEVNPE